jgi:hypothetical protein
MNESMKTFTVVMRGPSAVVFWQSESLRIEKVPSPFGPVTIGYTTRWLKRSEDVLVPGHLWVEITGTGDALENVLPVYANTALMLLPVLALSSNAAIRDPEIELGFDSTPGIAERDYFQSYVPPEAGIVHLGRHIDVNATAELIDTMARNPYAERLMRAAEQYRQSLDSWRLGGETLVLAHLWMASEVLTKPIIAIESAKRGCKNNLALAEQLGVKLEHLDSTIRKNFILNGDEDCYRKAKAASDGLEHGFLGFDTIRSHAADVRHRMSTYVRNTILELSNIEAGTLAKLIAEPFHEPIGHFPITKYIRGKLLGAGENLAAQGNAYPFVRWNPIIKSCKPNEAGKLVYEMTESFTMELGAGIAFQAGSYEAWKTT